MICRGPNCDTEIVWLESNKTGKKAPIEDEAVYEGNIRVDLDAGTYKVLANPDIGRARLAGEKLHLNHFARCPDQGSFR